MKVLGYIFVTAILVSCGIVLVKAGLWDQFTTWLSGLFKA